MADELMPLADDKKSLTSKLNASLDELIADSSQQKSRRPKGIAPRRGGRLGRPGGRKLSPEESAVLRCNVVTNEVGDVLVNYKLTTVIAVSKESGDIRLNSGGWRTISTLAVINEGLRPLGFGVEEEGGEWRVVDGRSSLLSFKDDMVIGSFGQSVTRPQLMARGSVMFQHLMQRRKAIQVSLASLQQLSSGPIDRIRR